MSAEPVANLQVDVGAKIDVAERNLDLFARKLERTAGIATRTAQEIQQSAQRTNRTAGATDQLTTSLKAADKAYMGLDKALVQAERNAAKQERTDQRLADAKIRAANAAKDYGRALDLIATEMQRAGAGSLRYTQLQERQIRVFQRANQEVRESRSAYESARAGVLQYAGAFGVFTSALAVANAAYQSAKRGFVLNAELDAQRRSLGILVQSQQRANEVFREATAFGQRYKYTQQEIGQAVGAASLLIKNSQAPIEDILGVMARLQVLNPKENFEGAAFAIKELASGDLQSLAERFNITRGEARKMRDEVLKGKDVFLVLDQYLSKVGVTTEVLQTRTEGAAGAINESKAASERLSIALGNFVQSQGATAFLNFLSAAADGVARIFNGQQIDFGLGGFNAQLAQGSETYAAYLEQVGLAEQALQEQGQSVAQLFLSYNHLTEAQYNALKAQELNTAETQAATLATQDQANATENAAAQALVDEANTQLAAAAKQDLADRAAAAAREILGSGAASDAARGQIATLYGVTLAQADAYVLLEQRARAAAIAMAAAQAYEQQIYDDSGTVIPGRGSRKPPGANRLDTIRVEQAKALAEAQRDATMATGSNAQQMALLKRELTQLVPGTAAYVRKQTEIKQLQQQINAEAARGAKASQTAANKAQREAEKAQREAERLANEAARKAEEREKARLALLDDEAKLREFQKKLSVTTDETERMQLQKEILDLEKKITEEKLRQNKAAVDARLAAIEDRKQRREDAKELAKARRILDSASASAEMKQAARDVLERIPLEQQKRALDIEDKRRDAGAAPGALPPRSTLPATPGIAAQAITTMPVGTPNLIAAPSVQAGTPQPVITLDLNLFLDSEQIYARWETKLRTSREQALAAGRGGRS